MTTGAPPSKSASVKSRPRSMGVPRTRKSSAPTLFHRIGDGLVGRALAVHDGAVVLLLQPDPIRLPMTVAASTPGSDRIRASNDSMELDDRLIAANRRGRRDAEYEEAGRAHSEIRAAQVAQRSHEQAGADQQRERRARFVQRRRSCAPRMRARSAVALRPRGLAARRRVARCRAVRSGGSAEDECRQRRQRQRVCEHGRYPASSATSSSDNAASACVCPTRDEPSRSPCPADTSSETLGQQLTQQAADAAAERRTQAELSRRVSALRAATSVATLPHAMSSTRPTIAIRTVSGCRY